MTFLIRLLAHREFSLPEFNLAPLAFELGCSPDDELAGTTPSAPASRSPGEIRESIERHLRLVRAEDDPPLLEQDAVDELRDALAELRRSLG